jgi:hypothetical protein
VGDTQSRIRSEPCSLQVLPPFIFQDKFIYVSERGEGDIPRINAHVGFTNMLLPVGCRWFVADLKVTAKCIWMKFRKETTVTKLRKSSDLCRVTENIGSVGLSTDFREFVEEKKITLK